MRHFSYDPFSSIPAAEATVGALRRKAAGHDVSIQAKGRRRADLSTRAADLGKR